jgi:imidazolonepropionase-like amidohydrolase
MLAIVAGLLAPFCGLAQPAGDYAITHAKIVTLTGPPIEDGTVLIHGGKIAAVGAAVQVPPGAQVIDAKGLQVYPGLFDAVTQMGLREIGSVPATVDTTEIGSFNPDLTAATAVEPSSAHIPVTRAAGVTQVIAAPASGGLDSDTARSQVAGQASAIQLAGWTINEMLLRKSAAMVLVWPSVEMRHFDYSTFTIKEKSYSDAKKEYDKQVEQLAGYFEQARHYAQVMQLSGAASSSYAHDVKLEAMAAVMRGELPVLVFADTAREIRDSVEFSDKQKVKMILAGGKEAWKVKELLRSKEVPVILRPTTGEPPEEDSAYDRMLTQPEELREAGIKVAFASFDNSFSRRLGQQAANAVAHGLPHEEGLKGVTLYPAQMFGLDSQLGTLEAGKAANLIVTNGDPLDVTTEVRYLFIQGRLTSTDNKQKALYEKYLNRPKPAQ